MEIHGGLILPKFNKESETYMEFWNRLLSHQLAYTRYNGDLDEDELLPVSHLNLLAVFWLERLHCDLPELIASELAEVDGQPSELVPLIAERLDELLRRISDIAKTEETLNCDLTQFEGLDPPETPGWPPDDANFEITTKYELESDDGIQNDEDLETIAGVDFVKTKLEETESKEEELKPIIIKVKTEKKKTNKPGKRRAKQVSWKLIGTTKHERHLELRRKREKIHLQCDFCDFSVIGFRKLKAHYESEHGRVVHRCTRCDFRCDTTQELRRHNQALHRVKIKCEECGLEFINVKRLKSHKFKEHNEPGIQCELCSLIVSQEGILKNHIKGCIYIIYMYIVYLT